MPLINKATILYEDNDPKHLLLLFNSYAYPENFMKIRSYNFRNVAKRRAEDGQNKGGDHITFTFRQM